MWIHQFVIIGLYLKHVGGRHFTYLEQQTTSQKTASCHCVEDLATLVSKVAGNATLVFPLAKRAAEHGRLANMYTYPRPRPAPMLIYPVRIGP